MRTVGAHPLLMTTRYILGATGDSDLEKPRGPLQYVAIDAKRMETSPLFAHPTRVQESGDGGATTAPDAQRLDDLVNTPGKDALTNASVLTRRTETGCARARSSKITVVAAGGGPCARDQSPSGTQDGSSAAEDSPVPTSRGNAAPTPMFWAGTDENVTRGTNDSSIFYCVSPKSPTSHAPSGSEAFAATTTTVRPSKVVDVSPTAPCDAAPPDSPEESLPRHPSNPAPLRKQPRPLASPPSITSAKAPFCVPTRLPKRGCNLWDVESAVPTKKGTESATSATLSASACTERAAASPKGASASPGKLSLSGVDFARVSRRAPAPPQCGESDEEPCVTHPRAVRRVSIGCKPSHECGRVNQRTRSASANHGTPRTLTAPSHCEGFSRSRTLSATALSPRSGFRRTDSRQQASPPFIAGSRSSRSNSKGLLIAQYDGQIRELQDELHYRQNLMQRRRSLRPSSARGGETRSAAGSQATMEDRKHSRSPRSRVNSRSAPPPLEGVPRSQESGGVAQASASHRPSREGERRLKEGEAPPLHQTLSATATLSEAESEERGSISHSHRSNAPGKAQLSAENGIQTSWCDEGLVTESPNGLNSPPDAIPTNRSVLKPVNKGAVALPCEKPPLSRLRRASASNSPRTERKRTGVSPCYSKGRALEEQVAARGKYLAVTRQHDLLKEEAAMMMQVISVLERQNARLLSVTSVLASSNPPLTGTLSSSCISPTALTTHSRAQDGHGALGESVAHAHVTDPTDADCGTRSSTGVVLGEAHAEVEESFCHPGLAARRRQLAHLLGAEEEVGERDDEYLVKISDGRTKEAGNQTGIRKRAAKAVTSDEPARLGVPYSELYVPTPAQSLSSSSCHHTHYNPGGDSGALASRDSTSDSLHMMPRLSTVDDQSESALSAPSKPAPHSPYYVGVQCQSSNESFVAVPVVTESPPATAPTAKKREVHPSAEYYVPRPSWSQSGSKEADGAGRIELYSMPGGTAHDNASRRYEQANEPSEVRADIPDGRDNWGSLRTATHSSDWEARLARIAAACEGGRDAAARWSNDAGPFAPKADVTHTPNNSKETSPSPWNSEKQIDGNQKLLNSSSTSSSTSVHMMQFKKQMNWFRSQISEQQAALEIKGALSITTSGSGSLSRGAGDAPVVTPTAHAPFPTLYPVAQQSGVGAAEASSHVQGAVLPTEVLVEVAMKGDDGHCVAESVPSKSAAIREVEELENQSLSAHSVVGFLRLSGQLDNSGVTDLGTESSASRALFPCMAPGGSAQPDCCEEARKEELLLLVEDLQLYNEELEEHMKTLARRIRRVIGQHREHRTSTQ